MESESKAYKFRVFGIKWDVADEIEEGETYDDVVKRRNLPSETEVEFIHNNNPTYTELVDAIEEVLCIDYNFCVVSFEHYKLLEEKEEEQPCIILQVCLEDERESFVHLFHKEESAIQYVLDRIKYDDIRQAARESLDECMCWVDEVNEITYSIHSADFED